MSSFENSLDFKNVLTKCFKDAKLGIQDFNTNWDVVVVKWSPRSKVESHWAFSFNFVKLHEKNENKRKRGWGWHKFYRIFQHEFEVLKNI